MDHSGFHYSLPGRYFFMASYTHTHTTRVVLKHRQIVEDNVAFSSTTTALDYVSVSIVSAVTAKVQ